MTINLSVAVGDRVRIVNRGEGWDGVTATVRKVLSNSVVLDSESPDRNGTSSGGHYIGKTDIGAWSANHLELIGPAVPAIGDAVDTLEKWNALPLGAQLRDSDGWIHTKIADGPASEAPDSRCSTYVDETGLVGTFGSPWLWGTVLVALPVVEEPETVPEEEPEHPRGTAPLVLEHKTSRMYAKVLRSAKLGAEDMLVLRAAYHGEQVDAYAFRKAVTHGLRVAVTRVGKRYDSAYREERARQAAHLLHIADAVIDNHRMGLESMEPGERSPALAAERERTAALIREKTELELAAEERDKVLAEARVELDKAVERAVEAEQDAAAKAMENAELRKEMAAARHQVEAYRRTLTKAQALFREAEAPRYADLLDGYAQALLELPS